jgi:hypothetical protein
MDPGRRVILGERWKDRTIPKVIEMVRYAITRILWLIPTLLCMIIFLFTLTHFAPGDPVDVMCGPRAS